MAHSLLLIHSGLQFGGDPIYSCKQEHEGESLITLHSELGPHGLGLHGSDGVTISSMIGTHRVNGSPENLVGQLQMGL